MTSVSGSIIYGIVSNDQLTKAIRDYNENYDYSNFFPIKNGNSDYWFGLYLDEISEGSDVDLEELIPKIYDFKLFGDYDRRFSELANKLPNSIREFLGRPKLMIVWTNPDNY